MIESDPFRTNIRVNHKVVDVTPAEIKVKWVRSGDPGDDEHPGSALVKIDLSRISG